jgi:hypothetical protein
MAKLQIISDNDEPFHKELTFIGNRIMMQQSIDDSIQAMENAIRGATSAKQWT